MPNPRSKQDPQLRVFYDGECPRCRKLASRYTRLDTAKKLSWVDLNSSRDALTEAGIATDAAMTRLHVVDGEGKVHAGVGGLEALWRTLPRRRWLSTLAKIAPVRYVMGIVYDFVARRRVREPRPR